jgi:hypothetical protein
MARVCRQGGVVAAYAWDYAGRMEPMRHFWDAAVALDPAAAELDEGRRFPVCQPGLLAALWRGAGLSNVEVRAIDVPTDFRSGRASNASAQPDCRSSTPVRRRLAWQRPMPCRWSCRGPDRRLCRVAGGLEVLVGV